MQYYIILSRLPIVFPPLITRVTSFFAALTGVESAVTYSTSCLVPGLDSPGTVEQLFQQQHKHAHGDTAVQGRSGRRARRLDALFSSCCAT